ncbi:UDP-N-acetylmuramate dehydrogenase [Candidatus Wolfebacteria bacterium]|nr:UDP-N-acetylmuramate dehydrogenase [Candidatus Wolfebacteria bacterium]
MFEQKNLQPYSHIKIGGIAEYFSEPKTINDLVMVVAAARKLSRPIFILGGGTNILFRNSGLRGAVVKPSVMTLRRDGDFLRVGSSVLIAQLLDYSITHSLSGLEWAGGLPGTVGGAIYGNAGAFRGEIKDSVVNVVSVDIAKKNPTIVRRSSSECGFDYRSSIFKENTGKEIIVEALLRLPAGNKKAIRSAIHENIKYREDRQPLIHPNIGSIFKNVDLRKIPKAQHGLFSHVIKTDPFPVVPTAHLIAEAGLKGVSCGGAMISPKHPNFIVNILDATAVDVLNLIDLVKQRVKRKFGIVLEEEVIIV